jgi:RNA polymerase sigma-32 factor
MAFTQETNSSAGTKSFVRHAMQEEFLLKEDEYALIDRWQTQQDAKALERLINAHSRLVVSIVQKFRPYGLPLSDLIQEGHIGLLQAANRFETDKDVRFSTYATWWIKACCQDFVLRNWSIVRTGTTAAHKSLFFNLRRLRGQIEDKTTESLNQAGRVKIAETLQVKVKDVEEMEVRLAAADQSLNTICHTDSDDAWQDFLVDTRPTPEEAVITLNTEKQERNWLKQALNALPSRERQIILARRLSNTAVTLEELGEKLGISKERVRQLEARALERMKVVLLKVAAQ